MTGPKAPQILPNTSPVRYGTYMECFQVVLKHEGGYGDDPGDPGGPTKYGVALNEDGPALTKMLGHKPTAEDIKNLTEDQAGQIFKENYWNPMQLDKVADHRCQTVLFDMCVLRGLSGATKSVQGVCRLPVDGKMGPQTLNAINEMDPLKFCKGFLDDCQAHFSASSQTQFIKGWTNRVNDLRKSVGV